MRFPKRTMGFEWGLRNVGLPTSVVIVAMGSPALMPDPPSPLLSPASSSSSSPPPSSPPESPPEPLPPPVVGGGDELSLLPPPPPQALIANSVVSRKLKMATFNMTIPPRPLSSGSGWTGPWPDACGPNLRQDRLVAQRCEIGGNVTSDSAKFAILSPIL
ncbi:MAG: hypothetical protein CBC10_004690 [Gammaproteobacteria bacterium TMED50]|nr:MAG: hypothetical protein CBC10_004690 [Gammaproteobacteria bacterium TMED50]